MRLPVPKEKSKKERLLLWRLWLKNFKAYSAANGMPEIKYIPNAAWLLNDLYWRIIEQYLRPILKAPAKGEEEHKVHPYKIISASEITIMMVEPIVYDADKKDEKLLNATLGWFIGTSIIKGWDHESPVTITEQHIETVAGYKEHIGKNKRYPESFAREHIQWLSILNVTMEKPFLINAQNWRLFHIACMAVAANGKLK